MIPDSNNKLSCYRIVQNEIFLSVLIKGSENNISDDSTL